MIIYNMRLPILVVGCCLLALALEARALKSSRSVILKVDSILKSSVNSHEAKDNIEAMRLFVGTHEYDTITDERVRKLINLISELQAPPTETEKCESFATKSKKFINYIESLMKSSTIYTDREKSTDRQKSRVLGIYRESLDTFSYICPPILDVLCERASKSQQNWTEETSDDLLNVFRGCSRSLFSTRSRGKLSRQHQSIEELQCNLLEYLEKTDKEENFDQNSIRKVVKLLKNLPDYKMSAESDYLYALRILFEDHIVEPCAKLTDSEAGDSIKRVIRMLKFAPKFHDFALSLDYNESCIMKTRQYLVCDMLMKRFPFEELDEQR